ncbi:MFS transporter [Kocuria sp. 2SI]|uniref:MFS transporter n=1 Tax=Kocuria sp. 2SI TaxID=2502203 RepID=UPI0010F93AFD|nr:MFS transporter [Kocuria sp. 2SI]
MHLGLGAFHRAHQLWYTQHSEADPSDPQWGFASFTGRSPRMSDLLSAQDGLFTLMARGPESDEPEIIGALSDPRASDDVRRLWELLAAPSTAVVTLTITEAAYDLGPEPSFDAAEETVAADLGTLRADFSGGSFDTDAVGVPASRRPSSWWAMWNRETDAVEYGEWKTGIRNAGTTYAIFSFVRKMAQGLGGWAGLQLIGQFGCVSGAAAQPDSAITGISLAAGVATAAFFLLAAILVLFYPLTDQRPAEILLDLRTRKDTGILPTAARQEMEAARGAAGASPAAAPSSADGADGPQYDGGSSSAPDDQGPAAR